MKLQLKCDGENCGKVGTPEEISTDYDNRDLCVRCKLIYDLKDLTDRREKLRVEHQRYSRELGDANNRITQIVDKLKTHLDPHQSMKNFTM